VEEDDAIGGRSPIRKEEHKRQVAYVIATALVVTLLPMPSRNTVLQQAIRI